MDIQQILNCASNQEGPRSVHIYKQFDLYLNIYMPFACIDTFIYVQLCGCIQFIQIRFYYIKSRLQSIQASTQMQNRQQQPSHGPIQQGRVNTHTNASDNNAPIHYNDSRNHNILDHPGSRNKPNMFTSSYLRSMTSEAKTAEELSQQMKLYILLAYFHTIETIYKTWNFSVQTILNNSFDINQGNKNKRMDGPTNMNNNAQQAQQNQAVYLPYVSLIGNINQLQKFMKIPKKCNLACPPNCAQHSQTELMKGLFITTYDRQEKYLLFKTNDYKNIYIKYFNRMLKSKRENKNQKYLLTNLLPVYYYSINNKGKDNLDEITLINNSINSNVHISKPSTNVDKKDRTGMYFLMQPHTQIIQIFEPFYQTQIKQIQHIVDQDFKFSNLKLSKIYSTDQLDKNCKDGFMIQQIKQRFETKRDKDNKRESFTIVGVVTGIQNRIQWNSSKNHNQNYSMTKKELCMWITQVMYRAPKSKKDDKHTNNCETLLQPTQVEQIGRSKLIIKYSQDDAEYIQNLFQNSHIYVITDPEIIITDNLNVIYQVNIPKGNAKNCCIFRVSQFAYEGINFGAVGGSKAKKQGIDQKFNIKQIQNVLQIKLETIKISKLLEKCINRNIIKLQVGLLQVQILYGSIRCSICGIEIKRDINLDQECQKMQTKEQYLNGEYYNQPNQMEVQFQDEHDKLLHCRKYHKNHHSLKLWGTVRVADESGSCLLSMQHTQIIKFLQLQPYYYDLQNFVYLNGRGMVLLSSNKQRNLASNLTPEQDILLKIKNRIRRTYVEKQIIGCAKTQLDKTFRSSLSEEEQLDYQVSFQNTKKYLQQKKIFPNGLIEKKTQQILLLPYIKVLQVVDLQWWA